jgi:hypothetical protein
LSRDEFRDNLRMRFGLTPKNLPQRCDGCGAKFSVEHAMQCKNGGLVSVRHDGGRDEWADLLCDALTPGAVSTEPSIKSGRTADGDEEEEGADAQEVAAEVDETAAGEARGDVSGHGFWAKHWTTIFDIRISDTDAPSHQMRDPIKVLDGQEREKKRKYLQVCLERRRHFTPLVFSVDGMMGTETQAATKQLASHLSRRSQRAYSQMVRYVQTRMSLSLCRATSLLLRGARDGRGRSRDRPHWDGSETVLYQTREM